MWFGFSESETDWVKNVKSTYIPKWVEDGDLSNRLHDAMRNLFESFGIILKLSESLKLRIFLKLVNLSESLRSP